MFNLIFKSQTSFTFEIDNNDIYETKEFDVYVNDILYLSNFRKNVFSIFDLVPDTTYSIKVIQGNNECVKEEKTCYEYVCLDVKRFGAKGDGETNDTAAIQAAIMCCPKDGRVLLEDGVFYTGPLFLKSDITIEIKKNAKLLGDTNRYNYPILPGMTYTSDEKDEYNLGSWEGNPLSHMASIITGINVSNVNIIGEGIIDENSQNSDWWQDHHSKVRAWRPRGVFLNNCSNISLQGITVTNTPSWNLHPYFSKNLNFIDLKLISPKDAPNTDGCDPESCDGVNIIGTYFSVGDDCIAIKAGKIYMGRKYKKPSENFVIRNCSMNFGHGAIVLGSEMSGGIKNIKVSKCLFNSTDRGLRIKTRRGRGKDAIIDGITFENIKMDNVLTPLVMNMFYFCDPDGHTEYVYSKEKLPVDDRTPYLGEFVFKDIDCENVNACAGCFYGLPEMPIKSITIDNVTFDYAANPKASRPAMMDGLDEMKGRGLIFAYVDKVNIKNVKFVGLKEKEFELNQVNEFNK